MSITKASCLLTKERDKNKINHKFIGEKYMEYANINTTLLKFAREMKAITEEFEEEVEILLDKKVMENISKSEDEFKKGKFRRFGTIDAMKKEL